MKDTKRKMMATHAFARQVPDEMDDAKGSYDL